MTNSMKLFVNCVQMTTMLCVQVRLGQLKRTQEKLKIDLDQCVLRRDLMVDAAQVRITKHSISNTARLKSLRRFETAKHNNRQLKAVCRIRLPNFSCIHKI